MSSAVLPDPNRFDVRRIAASSLVASLEYRPSLPSTQDLAVQLAQRDDLKTPALVLCSRQTAGRGRGGNRWWAAEGALTFSLVVDAAPEGAPDQPDPRQSLAAGLAVCEVIRELAPERQCGLKWPNDVYLAGRKVCGVLVETVARATSGPRRTIFGAGMNVNNPVFEAPAEVASAATSLFDATGRHHDLTDLLLALLEQLARELAQLQRSQPDQADRWQARSLLTGRNVRARQGACQLEGRCLRIDAEGALVLVTVEGEKQTRGGIVEHVDPPLHTAAVLKSPV
jgi:BirA family biotin operon repressor/biotin-[acetyl-CoA-carboxylase] ligase